jgi:hypothetical protein
MKIDYYYQLAFLCEHFVPVIILLSIIVQGNLVQSLLQSQHLLLLLYTVFSLPMLVRLRDLTG